MTATSVTPFTTRPDAGLRLTEYQKVWDAIVNATDWSEMYGLVATGNSKTTALPLTAVLNQVDTTAASTAVNLPLSTGKSTTPFNFCYVYNNGANALTVYPAQTGSDTVNGTTSFTLAPGARAMFFSIKPGTWLSFGSLNSVPSALTGTFTANSGTAVTVTNANVTANSTVIFGLKTVGGTPAAPFMVTVTAGTGFTVNSGASDTSVYNYTIIN